MDLANLLITSLFVVIFNKLLFFKNSYEVDSLTIFTAVKGHEPKGPFTRFRS